MKAHTGFIYTLIGTAKLNAVDPEAYLWYVLELSLRAAFVFWKRSQDSLTILSLVAAKMATERL